jgi:NifB/MoaA-like Fe-S oxidoreductase
VVAEVMDLMIGTNIDGVFVDMQVVDAIRNVVGIEEGEEVLAAKVEQVEANIIEVDVLENEVKVFGEFD